MVGDQVVATAHNETVAERDLTRHAELTAIRSALKTLGVDRLTDGILYVTVEPCAQCAGAAVLARVGRVVFGAYEPKTGMGGSVGDLLRHPVLNHSPEVRGWGDGARVRGAAAGVLRAETWTAGQRSHVVCEHPSLGTAEQLASSCPSHVLGLSSHRQRPGTLG